MLSEILITIVDAVGTANDVLLVTSTGEDHVLIGDRDVRIAVIHRLSVETVARHIHRNCVSVDITREGSITALQRQISGCQSEHRSCLVNRHHNLLDGGAVAAHIISGVVNDVVVGTGAGERRALNVHMAHLTVISNRSQPNAVEVLVRAVSPEVTLDRVNLEVAEAWCDLILNINALVVTHCHGVTTAIGSNGRPRTDDAVATGADTIDNVVGVVQARSSQITVVRICGRSRSRVAWVEVYVAKTIHVERDVSRCIHRDFWLRVVFDRDGLHVEGLVAEAIRRHPSTVQHAAAARSV